MALGRRFGKQGCRIAALGQELWRTALGTTLWACRGTALGSSFEEQLCTAALKKEPQLWGAPLGVALERNFGEQFSAATLGSSFPQFWGNSFGEQRRGTALGSSFREEL